MPNSNLNNIAENTTNRCQIRGDQRRIRDIERRRTRNNTSKIFISSAFNRILVDVGRRVWLQVERGDGTALVILAVAGSERVDLNWKYFFDDCGGVNSWGDDCYDVDAVGGMGPEFEGQSREEESDDGFEIHFEYC